METRFQNVLHQTSSYQKGFSRGLGLYQGAAPYLMEWHGLTTYVGLPFVERGKPQLIATVLTISLQNMCGFGWVSIEIRPAVSVIGVLLLGFFS